MMCGAEVRFLADCDAHVLCVDCVWCYTQLQNANDAKPMCNASICEAQHEYGNLETEGMLLKHVRVRDSPLHAILAVCVSYTA